MGGQEKKDPEDTVLVLVQLPVGKFHRFFSLQPFYRLTSFQSKHRPVDASASVPSMFR